MARLRVLVVDDAPEVMLFVTRFLRRDSRVAVVGQASTGVEAVLLSRELAPDLVLLDVAMPKMSGLTAAALIKAERPSTKVLLMSVHDDEEYHRAAATVGADFFSAKEKLPEAIAEILDTLTVSQP